MDLINNLLYASRNPTGQAPNQIPAITPNNFSLPAILPVNLLPANRGNYFAYNINAIQEFCAFDDPDFIEDSIQKHWADLVLGRNYQTLPADIYQNFRDNLGQLLPPYHLIYSYLVENTRIAQIFEKLIYIYVHDEKLSKATTPQNRLAFQWILNTETLFYSNLKNTNLRNINSQIRTHPEMTRRNAYFRLFGMELAFSESANREPINYHKSEFNNRPFIILFEKFLTEVWQAYTNARNQVGQNSTDLFIIVDTAQKLQELLMARRTTETNFNNYRYFNLSKEEFSSVLMMSWLYEVISYDSPLIQFLRCNGGTPGERLINIGNKVGLSAHGKSEGLLDIAPPMNTLLRRIEIGDYSQQNINQVRDIIESQVPGRPLVQTNVDALNDLLLVINNWEKATGHRIKNPEGNITGTVKIQSNGVSLRTPVN
jgi:hypothetical protein